MTTSKAEDIKKAHDKGYQLKLESFKLVCAVAGNMIFKKLFSSSLSNCFVLRYENQSLQYADERDQREQ